MMYNGVDGCLTNVRKKVKFMGLRFRKSIKLAPGVKLNLGKKSAGISLGGKYGGVSFNTKSGARARVSAPGTGISYTTKIGGTKSPAKTSNSASNVTNKGGGCLISLLKIMGIIILLPYGWIAGLYWVLVKRKNLNDEPERQKKETLKIAALSALSFILMLATCSTGSESNNATISTETSTEYVATETTTQVSTELTNILETEISTEMATELVGMTESTETTVADVSTETLPEEEASVVTEQIPAPITVSSEKEEVLVWVDATAARYHKKNGCGMNNAYQVTLEEAEGMGKTPCGRCYK